MSGMREAARGVWEDGAHVRLHNAVQEQKTDESEKDTNDDRAMPEMPTFFNGKNQRQQSAK